MLRCALLALPLLLALGTAHADRPFIAVTSAAAEEDDDRVWSVSTAFERWRGTRQLGIAAEYAFDPVTSIEVELGRTRVREGDERETEVEVEIKYLFNHIARDGYGWGLSLSLGAQRESGAGWRGGGWALTLPASLQLGESEVLLHANAGLVRERGERRRALLAFGMELPVTRRVGLFAEGVREGEAKLMHAGARWWLQREKLAIDSGVTRRRGVDAGSSSGLSIALSWYDL